MSESEEYLAQQLACLREIRTLLGTMTWLVAILTGVVVVRIVFGT